MVPSVVVVIALLLYMFSFPWGRFKMEFQIASDNIYLLTDHVIIMWFFVGIDILSNGTLSRYSRGFPEIKGLFLRED